MRSLICALFLLTAWSSAFSQPLLSPQPTSKPDWMMLVVGKDTLVQGPMSDLVLMAANREIEKRMTVNFAFRISESNSKIRGLEIENSVLRISRDSAVKGKGESDAEVAKCRQDLIGCGIAGAKNKGWATIGKVGTITVCAGIAVVGATAILNTVR